MRISRVDGDAQPITLLLAGLAINALAGGLLGLIAYSYSDPTLRAITLWLFGSLDRAGWSQLAVAMPAILIASLLLWRMAPALNVILLGEAEAAHIGVKVDALKRSAIVLAGSWAEWSAALDGVIGYIGLLGLDMRHLSRGTITCGLRP